MKCQVRGPRTEGEGLLLLCCFIARICHAVCRPIDERLKKMAQIEAPPDAFPKATVSQDQFKA